MRCLALRHVTCEDLGAFTEPILKRFNNLTYIDMEGDAPPPPALSEVTRADLVVALGGPMAVYEADRFPFIRRELALLRERISQGKPTLGICLGAQIMAAAAGGRVTRGGRQEIGWYPVRLEPPIAADPVFGKLAQGSDMFFHWHGDTFDLPPGSRPLGSSQHFANQGFVIGRHAVALQFHVEITPQALESWLKVYGPSLKPGPAVMPPDELRRGAILHGASLQKRGQTFLEAWLEENE